MHAPYCRVRSTRLLWRGSPHSTPSPTKHLTHLTDVENASRGPPHPLALPPGHLLPVNIESSVPSHRSRRASPIISPELARHLNKVCIIKKLVHKTQTGKTSCIPPVGMARHWVPLRLVGVEERKTLISSSPARRPATSQLPCPPTLVRSARSMRKSSNYWYQAYSPTFSPSPATQLNHGRPDRDTSQTPAPLHRLRV